MGCLVVVPAEHSLPTEPSDSLYTERVVSSLKALAGGTRAGGTAQALTPVAVSVRRSGRRPAGRAVAPPVGPTVLAGGDVGEPGSTGRGSAPRRKAWSAGRPALAGEPAAAGPA